MSDNEQPKSKRAKGADTIEIPFVSQDEIATGQEERIQLFAAIAASGQYVPVDWLLSELGIKRASLPSLTSRYKYNLRSAQTKDGTKVVKLVIRE